MKPEYTANVFTYLQWRGDITFEKSPFCPVDNLIFCCLSYLNWDGIADGKSKETAPTLREAADMWDKQEPSHKQMRTPVDCDLMRAAAESERFGHIRLFHYAEEYSEEEQQQFAAITFLLNDQTIYAAFRGTDNTLIGWREDFNMSFLPQVPSQKDAAEYLQELLKMGFPNVLVGGHSKGGNLAVYAATHAPERSFPQIKAVYNNDGPGFSSGLLNSPPFLALQERVHTFVPQASVVGMLLEHDEDYRVIYSSQKGFLQHDPYSWCVIRNDWYYLQDVTAASKLVDGTLKAWLMGMEPEEREKFTDAVFHVLQGDNNARTLQELREGGFTSILRAWSDMPAQTRRFLQKTLVELLLTAHDLILAERKEQSPEEAYATIQERRKQQV